MDTEIHDRGRGPEIKGTRVTVFDILDYHVNGRDHAFIASVLGLSVDQVLSAIRYIDEHNDDVMDMYRRIVDRSEKAQAGEQDRVEAARRRVLARKREFEHSRKAPAGGPPNARAAG
jgi:uncharacterized protein (DUF433 family)